MSIIQLPADPIRLRGTAKARVPTTDESVILIRFGDEPDPEHNIVFSLADARQLRLLIDRALADPTPRRTKEGQRAHL